VREANRSEQKGRGWEKHRPGGKRQRHDKVSVGLRKSVGDEIAVARLVLILREPFGDEILVILPRFVLGRPMCVKPNPRAGRQSNGGEPNERS